MKTSFDTVAVSVDSKWRPDPSFLQENDAQTFLSQYTGEPYRHIINSAQNAKEPRITVTLTRKFGIIIHAEVSVPEWMNGSNLHVSSQPELEAFLDRLYDFVPMKLGIPFPAHQGRITRADIFRDLPLGTLKGLEIVKELSNRQIPTYNTHFINGRTTRFDNKGPRNGKKYELHKRIGFYLKQHQLLCDGANAYEVASAEGLLRGEIQHRSNRAVSQLAKSFGLPDHSAKNVLRVDVAEWLMDKELSRLKLRPVLERKISSIETLLANYDFNMAQVLIAHLTTKAFFGPDYYRRDFVTVTEKTIKRREKMCADVGVLSL